MSTPLLVRIERISLTLLATFSLASAAQAEVLTVESLYEKFNLRTIRSALAPVLKSNCYSYPRDFFPADSVTRASKSKLTLRRGTNVMSFELLADHKVRIRQSITDASYRSTTTYDLHFDANANEWRAGEIIVPVGQKCVLKARKQRAKSPAQNKPWAVRASPVVTLTAGRTLSAGSNAFRCRVHWHGVTS